MKILIVDDDQNSRELIRLAFAVYDCALLEAADGNEGLEIALREKPDILLIDQMMPQMTGYELFRKLHAEPSMKSAHFIMITVKQFDNEFPERLKMEGCEFIAKPYDFAALLKLIEKIIGPIPKRASSNL
ncbi:MAG: response regulator [Elusimicrobia bacterium]|nr:response regulator [Elusimicrobiota bacterium]